MNKKVPNSKTYTPNSNSKGTTTLNSKHTTLKYRALKLWVLHAPSRFVEPRNCVPTPEQGQSESCAVEGPVRLLVHCEDLLLRETHPYGPGTALQGLGVSSLLG